MSNLATLKPFSKDYQPDPKSKSRKGIPNRSTIAKRILAQPMSPPNDILNDLLMRYPSLDRAFTIEFILVVRLADRVVRFGDTKAYRLLMDRAYGKPKRNSVASTSPNQAVNKALGSYLYTTSDGETINITF